MMAIRRSGRMMCRTWSGATAVTGAGGGAASMAAAAGRAATAEGGIVAATAALQPGDKPAAFRSRQSSASLPPGVTPGQCAKKSERQDCRVAAISAAEGSCSEAGDCAGGAAFAARVVGAFGGTAAGRATDGSDRAAAAAGCCAAGAAGADGAAAAAGAAVAGLGGAGFAAAGLAGAGMTAVTAPLQEGDNLATLRSRHSRASRPPGWTPEQFAMKSERQELRMALVCAGVGCWPIAA